MTRRLLYSILACCALGLAASGGAAYVHYRLLTDPGYTSFCDISQTWSCAAVYESRYGAFRGIPVALGGLVWFAGTTLLAVAALLAPDRGPAAATPSRRGRGRPQPAAPPEEPLRRNIAGYLFAGSVIGLAFVLYLGYASLFVLKTFCILCLLTYVAVIGIFLLSGAATDVPMSSLPARALRDVRRLVSSPAALAVAVLFVAATAASIAMFPRQADANGADAVAAPAPLAGNAQSEFERWYTQQPRVPVMVPTDGAAVVVVKFNDYQCPPCKQTWMEYKPVLAKWQASHPGKVKYVSKDYPLEPECNVNALQGQHLAACEAAVAVRLAREKGRAEQLESWLFANQATMTPALVRQGVREVGQVADFEARYATVLEQVKGDVALGGQLGVRGTPTFFVNGVRIPGLKAEFFDAAIAYELRQAGVK